MYSSNSNRKYDGLVPDTLCSMATALVFYNWDAEADEAI
jgi:hypothetical protein